MQGLTAFFRRAVLGEHHRLARALVTQLQREYADAYLCRYLPDARFRVTTIHQTTAAQWRSFVILVTTTELRLYPVEDALGEPFVVPAAALRWFGRPKKYDRGRNVLWLHVEQVERWQWVEIDQYYADTTRLVRALKAFAPHLVTPYRRQRPYVHFGPIAARAATQDVHGAWTLHEAVDLYLTPLELVLLDGPRVRSTLPVETVTAVRGIQRLDAPGGVVRFQAGGETHGFAVDDYRGLATALAEAARRSLEQPLEMLETKRKKKRHEDD